MFIITSSLSLDIVVNGSFSFDIIITSCLSLGIIVGSSLSLDIFITSGLSLDIIITSSLGLYIIITSSLSLDIITTGSLWCFILSCIVCIIFYVCNCRIIGCIDLSSFFWREFSGSILCSSIIDSIFFGYFL